MSQVGLVVAVVVICAVVWWVGMLVERTIIDRTNNILKAINRPDNDV